MKEIKGRKTRYKHPYRLEPVTKDDDAAEPNGAVITVVAKHPPRSPTAKAAKHPPRYGRAYTQEQSIS